MAAETSGFDMEYSRTIVSGASGMPSSCATVAATATRGSVCTVYTARARRRLSIGFVYCILRSGLISRSVRTPGRSRSSPKRARVYCLPPDNTIS
eukprot:COSAG06_NODE_4692_length_4031_cov_4.370869_3_plen_95_part_00